MRNDPTRRIAIAALSVAAATLATSAWSQQYPVKPVRLILPVPPGGVADTAARPLAQQLSRLLGQQIVIDYRPGATGAIGLRLAAAAPADGYTLAWGSTNTMCMGPAYHGTPSPMDRFSAISPVILFPNVLVVHPALPAATTSRLIELGRGSATPLTFASSGSGSVNHLTAGMFAYLTKLRVTHVPYKGGGPALTDVMGGHVDALFATAPSAVAHVRTGKLKALMVTSTERLAAMPAVPNAGEAGVPRLVLATWNGVFAPAGTPPEIIAKLNTAIVHVAKEAELRDRLAALAAQVYTLDPARYERLVRSDYARWSEVVKLTGIRKQE